MNFVELAELGILKKSNKLWLEVEKEVEVVWTVRLEVGLSFSAKKESW